MRITIKNNTLTLLSHKAIWWEEEKILLISDLHIGKIAHFRKAGIAVPPQAAEQNFLRLDTLMAAHLVKQILFIGDLFHSDLNSEWDRFCTWRNRHITIDMSLILGNHDRFPVKYYQDICLTVYEEELKVGPFTFAHQPKEKPEENEYVISGHIHPVIKLKGLAHQQLKFPCFYFGTQQALLPSFGAFTGGYIIEPKAGDQVVAVVEEKLIRVV
jgi:DNA ligase-associated metallophosphoesterase